MNYSEEEKEALEILNNTEWDGFMITIKKIIKTQQAEIEKKNKIIDKMAQELFIEIEPHFDTVEQCREYYTKIVEGEKKDG